MNDQADGPSWEIMVLLNIRTVPPAAQSPATLSRTSVKGAWWDRGMFRYQ